MIVGNWKMHKTGQEARRFIQALLPYIEDTTKPSFLAVPFTAIPDAVEAAKGSVLRIGAQNMHDQESGAFTGEISPLMLHQAGVTFVILGHSERRELFFETSAFINRKIKSALKIGLTPLLCIGEREEERAQGLTQQVLFDQLDSCLEGLQPDALQRLIIAYEPIWAIGTGKSATPHIAEETHALMRSRLPKGPPLLYGGSVTPENADSLLSQPHIDGALVGGASLDLDSFVKIIHAQQPL